MKASRGQSRQDVSPKTGIPVELASPATKGTGVNVWRDRLLTWLRCRPEMPYVGLALLVYVVFQVHAAVFHGYWGQDFITHKTWVMQAAQHPWEFLTTYPRGRSSPPLYHILAGLIKSLVGRPQYLFAIALMNVALSIAGFLSLYAVTCRFISSRLLRVSNLVFVLFLPVAMIHSEVLATDALATPLFFVVLWLMVRLLESTKYSTRVYKITMVSLSALLAAAAITKFTFHSVILLTGIWLIVLWRASVIPRRQATVLFVALTIVPGLVVFTELKLQQTANVGIVWPNSLSAIDDASMNPRSVLFFRAADTDMFSAPPYNWTINGGLDLLIPNKHSFPALLHLAMFTDILNIYQYDPYDEYYGLRTMRNHRLMQTAVISGFIFSALALIGTALLLFRSSVATVLHRDPRNIVLFTVLFFSVVWFCNIVLLLPLVPGAYMGGFWTPRLVAPALLCFFAAGFALIDRMRREVRIGVVAIVLAQSALHASFLWPTISTGPFYEPDVDIATSREPFVVRVQNAQGSFPTEQGTGYWLGDNMGVVVYRRGGSPGPETRILEFGASPGPANPDPARTLRISCRGCQSQTLRFDRPTGIRVPVSIAAGRNDVLIERVAPEQVVEFPGDARNHMVNVSGLELMAPNASRPVSSPKITAAVPDHTYVEVKDAVRPHDAVSLKVWSPQGEDRVPGDTGYKVVYWLGDEVIFNIVAPEPRSSPELYILEFNANSGPGNPAPDRTIAITVPSGVTEQVTFTREKKFFIPVSVRAGNNRIALKLIRPTEQTVVIPNDPRKVLVLIREVRLRAGTTAPPEPNVH